jgi:hypothetical protein
MQDIFFELVEDIPSPHLTRPTIKIYTLGCASEDLQALIDRIRSGDTPCTRELVAILENIHKNIMEGEI